MAALAYLTAPWRLRVLMQRRWRLLPWALLATWCAVDGCYWIYWHFTDPVVPALLRDVNFLASLSLYGRCALVWLYNGSLQSLAADVTAYVKS